MTQQKLFAVEQTEYTSDDYYTPKWIFDALGLEFDLDVACPPEGPLFTPAKAFYTQADDGLAQPWHGLVWMNPPYSKPGPWVEKWLQHGNGLALLVITKSRWFESLWLSDADIAYMYGVKFHKDGKMASNSIPWPLGLWAIGETAKTAMRQSNISKVR